MDRPICPSSPGPSYIPTLFPTRRTLHLSISYREVPSRKTPDCPRWRDTSGTFFLTASLASLSVACASHDTNLRIHLRPSHSSKRRHLLGATPSRPTGLPRVWINAAGDEFANSVLCLLLRTICARALTPRNGCRHATAARHSSFPIMRSSAPQTDDPGDRNANASGRQY